MAIREGLDRYTRNELFGKVVALKEETSELKKMMFRIMQGKATPEEIKKWCKIMKKNNPHDMEGYETISSLADG